MAFFLDVFLISQLSLQPLDFLTWASHLLTKYVPTLLSFGAQININQEILIHYFIKR